MEKHLMAGRIRVWGFLSPSHLTLGLGDYVTNETLYLHFHNIYGHQTWQSYDIGLGDPSNLHVTLLQTNSCCNTIINIIKRFAEYSSVY